MKEMLNPTSIVMGAGLGDDVALITDGRYDALPSLAANLP
jgi:dihydroxy-acid dehydratase